MKKRINNHQRSTIKKVMNYIRRYWGYLGMSIVLAAVTVALTLYLPVLTGRAVDLILEKGVVDFAGILAKSTTPFSRIRSTARPVKWFPTNQKQLRHLKKLKSFH